MAFNQNDTLVRRVTLQFFRCVYDPLPRYTARVEPIGPSRDTGASFYTNLVTTLPLDIPDSSIDELLTQFECIGMLRREDDEEVARNTGKLKYLPREERFVEENRNNNLVSGGTYRFGKAPRKIAELVAYLDNECAPSAMVDMKFLPV